MLKILGIILLTLFLVGCAEDLGEQALEVQTPEGQRIDDYLRDRIGKVGGSQKCEGVGPVNFTFSPMRFEDFDFIEPYGLVAGGHVTPIDHQYFSPDFSSAPDTYEVRAIADGVITKIERRRHPDAPAGRPKDDFRFVIQHTCTFFSYFDLVTSVTPEIYELSNLENEDYISPNIPVKAGQVVGKIGGQTLDFAVWDLTEQLPGFISPELYDGEPWKIHTVDPFPYFVEPLRTELLAKVVRPVEPVAGKIDLDIPNTAQGNWFLEGTGGYVPDNDFKEHYYRGHLALVPEAHDPTVIIVSMGNYQGEALQFAGDGPDFSTVTTESGVVAYELHTYHPIIEDNIFLNIRQEPVVEGTVLIQVLPDEQLRFEAFPRKTADQVIEFTTAARLYER